MAKSFEIMRKYNLRLNPRKCNFMVGIGKYLGYMVTKIKPNSTWIRVIVDMKPPTFVKDV